MGSCARARRVLCFLSGSSRNTKISYSEMLVRLLAARLSPDCVFMSKPVLSWPHSPPSSEACSDHSVMTCLRPVGSRDGILRTALAAKKSFCQPLPMSTGSGALRISTQCGEAWEIYVFVKFRIVFDWKRHICHTAILIGWNLHEFADGDMGANGKRKTMLQAVLIFEFERPVHDSFHETCFCQIHFRPIDTTTFSTTLGQNVLTALANAIVCWCVGRTSCTLR